MKKLLLCATFLLGQAQAASTALGAWQEYDDQGHPQAIIRFEPGAGGTLTGRIVKVLQGPAGLCTLCTGADKNRPIEGLRIIWGLKPAGPNIWDGGRVFNPHSGKSYRLKIKLLDDGRRLELHGYLGIALLGRSKIFTRYGQ